MALLRRVRSALTIITDAVSKDYLQEPVSQQDYVDVLPLTSPVVADAAARDALYPTPVGDEKVFNKSTGRVERYNLPTAAWTGDTSAPVIANFRDANIKPTSGNDESSGAQTLVDQVSTAGGGGIAAVRGDYAMNVILKPGVHIVGEPGMGAPDSNILKTRLLAAATGPIIDTPGTGAPGAGLHNIYFRGLGAGTAATGIRFRTGTQRSEIFGCSFGNFADSCVQIDSGAIGNILTDLLATNCVLNRTRGALTGVFDINGTDHFLTRIEATSSSSIEGVVSSGSLFVVAFAIRMTNGFVTDCIGEISDIGYQVTGDFNTFKGSRADLNYGHGYLISGSENQFDGCRAINNSQDTTNTYDNWQISGVKNGFGRPVSAVTVAKQVRYGINDQAPASDSNKNFYSSPIFAGTHATAAINTAAGSNGASWTFPNGDLKTLTANSATPDVTAYERFVTANSSPTTITNFTGGVRGQMLLLRCNDANTTIQHNGSTITTPNGGDVKLRSGSWYLFVNNSAWKLISEDVSQFENVSADVGDTANTIRYRQNESHRIYNTALTANRKQTHSNTGAQAGATFKHERLAGATGASTIDLADNAGTVLKSLAVSQWAWMTYNGTAWYISASGGL